MRVLVTGAAGRLGSRAVEQLLAAGHTVRATDTRAPNDATADIVAADLRDHAAALDLLDGVDAVIHAANHPGIGNRSPQVVFNENTTMNTNVFQGAAERGLSRVVFISTLQLIGSHTDARTVTRPAPPPVFPIDGDTVPTPTNLYALSKTVAEHMLQYYADRCGLDAIALRLPLLHHHEERFSVASGREGPTDIFEGFTGLTYDDAARLCLAALTAPVTGYRSYMAGLAHRHRDLSVSELIDAFYPHAAAAPSGLIDMSTLDAELGWRPSDDYDREGTHR